MMNKLGLLLALSASMFVFACGGNGDDEATDEGGADLSASSTKSFVAKGTGYYPDNSAMEGGFVDRKGVKLNTLQDYLAGKAKYVSTAMDSKAFNYGQRLRIAELNKKYSKDIVFRVVDTGGAFSGKGTSRIDICTANSKAAADPTINSSLHIDAIPDNAPSVSVGGNGSGSTATGDDDDTPLTPSTPSPSPTHSSSSSSSSGGSSGGGSCTSDGACNPGNDGSGLICVSHQCVPGCHSDAQCPGVTSCKSGQCR
jgi:hypothetical protein